MILKSIVVCAGIVLIFCAVLYVRSQKPSRRIIVVDQLTTNEQIIGDGAWIITAAEFPPSGVLRKEHEPRGM